LVHIAGFITDCDAHRPGDWHQFTCILHYFAFSADQPSIAQIILLIGGTLMVWFLAPFIFAPHGIFTFHTISGIPFNHHPPGALHRCRQPTIHHQRVHSQPGFGPAQGRSARKFMDESGWHLWTRFYFDSLLAASFIYYRDVLQWLQEMMQLKLEKAAEVQPQNDSTGESR
jgi:hypothetical protein